LKRVGLEDKAKLKIEKLSGGQQQKIQLGITIIGRPDLLILDEPTKGFDPVNRELLMEIIKEENARGATVIMVTHQMEEVEKICDRAILLKNGKCEAYGKVDEIREKYGEKYDALKEMLVPGIFLVIFYYIVGFLSNRMLTSTTEEKENRVTEMILTSISAKTLVVGKLISILILGAIQIFALLVPILIAFLGFSKNLGLPNLSNFTDGIVWDGMTILKASLILVFGLLMTVGAIIALGSAMPTAQEASNYFGFIIMLLMAPFFVIPMFFTAEKTIAVDFLSYFPLTSPISLLIRNTLGTLSNEEAFIGIGLLVVFGAIAIWMAVRIFQFGTLSYGKKVSLKSLFASSK
jgi:ABC-2 type transport system permease protein